MKKKLLLTLISFMASVCLLSACGGGSGNQTPTDPPKPEPDPIVTPNPDKDNTWVRYDCLAARGKLIYVYFDFNQSELEKKDTTIIYYDDYINSSTYYKASFTFETKDGKTIYATINFNQDCPYPKTAVLYNYNENKNNLNNSYIKFNGYTFDYLCLVESEPSS